MMKGLNFRNWTRRRVGGTTGTTSATGVMSTISETSTVVKPPPPDLPGIRRFSLAGSSGTNLQLMGLSEAVVPTAPVIPVAAFEIVPGAEDSDGEDDSAEGGSTNNRHVQQSELHHHHQHHSHHHHHQHGDQQLDNQDSQNNSDENTGKTNATTTTLSNGLLALAAILQRRRGSSATVSSWMEDQSIYDEAEVRSALPCFALMGGDQTETSSLEVLQQPAPRLPPPTYSSQAPLLKSLQQPISVVPPKRVIVIALDSSDSNPLHWTLANTILQPQRDLVVVLNVRPDVVISSAVLEANGGIAVKIEDDNKQTSHGFLKSQIQVLSSHEILAKGLALRGDPRHGIIKTLKELDADMLILGPHHGQHPHTIWVTSSSSSEQPCTKKSGQGLGSVSDYVLRNASCSVLVAREKGKRVV